jgi:hypothetical protein
MSQDLHDLFPADEALLRRLKMEDPHFRTLADRFAGLDDQVLRIERGEDPASDTRTEELKKQRLALLDEIAAHLATMREGQR